MSHSILDSKLLTSQNKFHHKGKSDYRLSLLHPFIHTNAKVPSELPIPSTTASLKYNFSLRPNATGKFLIVLDPFTNVISTCVLDSLTGSDIVTPVFTNTVCDHNSSIIDMWRLVSCELKVTYTGQIQQLSGFMTGTVTSNLNASDNKDFMNFTSIEDIAEKLTVTPIEGIRLVYIPRDPAMLDFQKSSDYSATGVANCVRKHLMIIYGDALPNVTCLRIDYVRNIEYVSRTSIREYIPHTIDDSQIVNGNIFTELSQFQIDSVN